MFETTHRVGSVEVVCGCMFSGKTEELLRRLRRAQIARQKVQVFKPAIDNRYSKTYVASHNANTCSSTPIHKSSELINCIDDDTRVVGIDEAQFFDDVIVSVVERLAKRGIRVLVAGLDMDYRAKPFGPMPDLMAIADSVTKLHAVCAVCGAPAFRTQRLSDDPDLIAVGAKDKYEARCREHHRIETHELSFLPIEESENADQQTNL